MATFHENLVQSFTNFKNKYITPIQTALNNKQDKLTNPLTQSDVVDNLSSTSTTTPLSAKQGKVLNDSLSNKASKNLGSPSDTFLSSTIASVDEKTATPVHWDANIGFPYILIDSQKHYLIRKEDIADNLSTNSSSKVLSAAQGYAMSRDLPWYGTCSTAANTTAKVATTNDSKFSLHTGAKVSIKFTYNNTASDPTLNVDSTGAKSIKAYGTTAPTSWWQAGDVVTFTYDGTNWIMGATEGQISQINSKLNYIGITYYKSGSKSVLSSTSGYTTIASQTGISAGMYIIIGQVTFESSSDAGSRVVSLSDGNGNLLSKDIEVQGNANGYTQLSINTLSQAAENQTVDLKVRQNSGNSITTTGVIRMIRIK